MLGELSAYCYVSHMAISLIIMEQKSVVGNYVAQWGEGPIWIEDALYYVDIEKHKVLRYLPEINAEESWDVGERVGAVVPRENGGLIIAGDTGFSFLVFLATAIIRSVFL